VPTAQQIINIAAGKLGAVSANTDFGTSESADALVVLNSMLDSWRLDRLMVYNGRGDDSDVIVARDLKGVGESMNRCMKCWQTLCRWRSFRTCGRGCHDESRTEKTKPC
jgi:hypothetical protein